MTSNGLVQIGLYVVVLLALAKPTYVVVALCYLVPLLDRARRRGSWPLLVPVGVGIAVSALWQRGTPPSGPAPGGTSTR